MESVFKIRFNELLSSIIYYEKILSACNEIREFNTMWNLLKSIFIFHELNVSETNFRIQAYIWNKLSKLMDILLFYFIVIFHLNWFSSDNIIKLHNTLVEYCFQNKISDIVLSFTLVDKLVFSWFKRLINNIIVKHNIEIIF